MKKRRVFSISVCQFFPNRHLAPNSVHIVSCNNGIVKTVHIDAASGHLNEHAVFNGDIFRMFIDGCVMRSDACIHMIEYAVPYGDVPAGRTIRRIVAFIAVNTAVVL